MREIKFRGKRVDNDEWVFGMLDTIYQSDRFTTISYLDKENYYCEDKVIPETTGQFTGLVDKNGKEIYEGDLLSVWRLGFNKIFEIKWRTEGEPKYILYPQPFNEDWWTCRSDMRMSWEVIGNIHDNKDLLK